MLHSRLPAGVRYEPLHRGTFVFLVAPDHPLAARGDVTAAEIDSAGLIVAPMGSVESVAWAEMLRGAGLTQYHVALEVDGVQARVLAARAGLGVFGAFVPPYADERAFAPLLPLRPNLPPATAEFGLVSREDREWTPIMREFAAWLRQVVSPA